jgi:DNA-binding MarR family transcriptional regulator
VALRRKVSDPPDDLAALYARPGFQFRRAHQASLSIFAEECAGLDLTTTQYGILVALAERPGMDQVGVGMALGFDRSTTTAVVDLLEARALLRRDRHPTDGRRRVLTLTPAGHALLRRAGAGAARARERLLHPLSAEERVALRRLLDRLLEHHDMAVRVKLRRPVEGG